MLHQEGLQGLSAKDFYNTRRKDDRTKEVLSKQEEVLIILNYPKPIVIFIKFSYRLRAFVVAKAKDISNTLVDKEYRRQLLEVLELLVDSIIGQQATKL